MSHIKRGTGSPGWHVPWALASPNHPCPVSGPGTEGQTQGSGPPLPLGACSHPVHPLLRNIPGVLPDPTTDAVLQAGPGPGLGGDTRARSGGKSTEFIRNADSMAPPQSSCMETPQGWAQLT